MSSLIKKNGYNFSFNPSACESCAGNCCIGESGYIWINIVEIEALSKYLGLTLDSFREKYLFKVGYKYSIKEVELLNNSFACCFFDLEKRKCSIYDYRPTQCRTFPFWEYFKNNEKEVYKECPAIKNI
ncbi:zinc/iron-chelating domain-containing protein [Aliarcobacter cryaerophilus ATCC 43158]|uniref:[Fe-S] cluster-containing protein n=1 Tax=Aliarcobacter cryaerophilus ATCC 43158 TaxID=1032070 RepID=A0AAD0XAB2_9BACT|nr:YkgJ family cysteine cluster protein [Aliarcobacter cryaerophilus]AYJ80197.1 putative [Fe-S] cluster-containing protein [Aliarcobacter cryaerophilus ATCC 43158]PRM97834.1 zinc/iron-chelating domain-containing protein [Aliarcobacter cryaerophilus]QCZ24416.1 zinc/iron-chelating domain-containing protein [Aliarcobacter cryaerophilus ATCC 43158]